MDFRDVKEFIKDTFGYIVTAIIILIIVIYVVSLEQVMGPSMEPTLKEGNIIVVNKILYKLKSISRNEIVVLKHNDKHYIKRVVGLPGEHIEYKDNILYVGDTAYGEPFISVDTNNFILEDLGYSVIPKDMYLVLGDNRGNSEDSRNIGLIKKEDIIGRASMRLWPLNQFKFIK